MFLGKNGKNESNENLDEKIDLEKSDFWILVKVAYKTILPFVLVVVLLYFLFTLFFTKVILKS